MIVDKRHAEIVWDRLAAGSFKEAQLREVLVGTAVFHVLFQPRKEKFRPDVYLDTGLSFYAWPRLAAYRHRFVLVPRDNMAGRQRWQMSSRDVADWIRWSDHMQHVITMSTFKSGASYPFSLHAQSFPLQREDGTLLTALRQVRTGSLVPYGKMPRFDKLEIHRLEDYAINGLRIAGDIAQVADKVYELALNYDGLKAFNVVVLPDSGQTPAAYFFPRRKDGRAIFGPARWQIAAVEVNGLLQAKSQTEACRIDEPLIKDIFGQTSPSSLEFQQFLTLLDSF